MTPRMAVSLTVLIIQKRDELILKINGKKKYLVAGSGPDQHTMLRAEAFNEGLDEAMRLVREIL